MLDNLVNPNLAGLTGHINYNYDSTVAIVPGLVAMFLFFVTLWLVIDSFSDSKTRKYRKKLVDLYVAGTIRKLAKDDGLDLDEEFKEFVKSEKKIKAQLKELDAVVEDKLKEDVTTAQEKTLDLRK